MNRYCTALTALKAASAHYLKEVGDQWCTPDPLFWGINALYGPLVLDLFADQGNSKCESYYTAEDNALTQDWSARLVELNGAAFANPPYSRASQHEGQYITGMVHIMEYTMKMRELGGRYVVLIKAATSETWWPEQADHIAFIRGRIGFDVPVWFNPADAQQVPTGAFFAGAIAVFDKTWTGPSMGYVNRDELIAHGETALAQMRWMAPRLIQQVPQQNIPEIIPLPDTDNRVWPSEVRFLLDQVPTAASLPAELKNKILNHINHMKLDGLPTAAIIRQAAVLSELMGAQA
jgi:phage N-6-adenine-methyltransferase